MVQNNIFKTKAFNAKSYQTITGVREIAEQVWGELKVSDSFLYLYRRFGKPSFDTRDEYKISYEYRFKYNGLFFSICGTTPNYVFLDCFIPNRLAEKGWKRFKEKESPIIEKALAEGVLYFPTPYYHPSNLEKKHSERWCELHDKRFEEMFGKEMLQKLEEKPFSELTEDRQREYTMKYYLPFYKEMAKTFFEWTKTAAPGFHEEIYNRNILLNNLPEVKETVVAFCKEMLRTEPVRDCNINIKGWQENCPPKKLSASPL